MDLTPEEIQEILDEEEWSPAIRASLQQQKSAAEKRAQQLARISEAMRQENLIRAWQGDTLLVLKRLLSECFEVVAWFSRSDIPLTAADANNRLLRKMRGMRIRLSKARRDTQNGCPLQREWLEDHAEMIAEFERYRLDEQPGKITRAALAPAA